MENDPKELAKLLHTRVLDYLSEVNEGSRHVTEFLGAADRTVPRWIRDNRLPTGRSQIKLWIFLRAAGYDSPEFEQMPLFNRYLTKLYAYDILDDDGVLHACGIKNMQGAFNIMRGRPPMHPNDPVDEMQLVYNEELVTAVQGWNERFGLPHVSGKPANAPPKPPKPAPAKPVQPPAEPPSAAPVVPSTPPAPEPVVGRKTSPDSISSTQPLTPAMLAAVGSSHGFDPTLLAAVLCGTLRPLLQELTTTTPAARERFRTLLGQQGLFDLQVLFVALQSERALKNHTNRK